MREGPAGPRGRFFASKRHIIVDSRYEVHEAVQEGSLDDRGMEVIRLPPVSLNLNVYAERFVCSINEECLRQMIFVGETLLRPAIGEFMAHYHRECNYQGLGNALIQPYTDIGRHGHTHRVQRLGGILNCLFPHRGLSLRPTALFPAV